MSDLIQTPYGRKTPELLCKAMDSIEELERLKAAVNDLFDQCAMIHKHWGDGSNHKEAAEAIATAAILIGREQ